MLVLIQDFVVGFVDFVTVCKRGMDLAEAENCTWIPALCDFVKMSIEVVVPVAGCRKDEIVHVDVALVVVVVDSSSLR